MADSRRAPGKPRPIIRESAGVKELKEEDYGEPRIIDSAHQALSYLC
jgi:hypothetical protein